jgi:hypothetical protein
MMKKILQWLQKLWVKLGYPKEQEIYTFLHFGVVLWYIQSDWGENPDHNRFEVGKQTHRIAQRIFKTDSRDYPQRFFDFIYQVVLAFNTLQHYRGQS